MIREIIDLWQEFLEEWIPKHPYLNETDGSFMKPEFYDFMQWLNQNKEKLDQIDYENKD